MVEQIPEFPDGNMVGLMEFIRIHLCYPEAVHRDSIRGCVIVQFVVMENGSIELVHIVCGISLKLDKEALRFVRSTPRWKPGRHRGKTVKVKSTIPGHSG